MDFTLYSVDDSRIFNPLFVQMHRDIIFNIDHCPFYLFPINSMGYGGVCFSALESIEWMSFNNVNDYEALLARINSIPIQLEQFISAMQIGMKKHIVASTAMLRNVENQLEDLIKNNFPELRAPLELSIANELLSTTKRNEFEIAINKVKNAFELFLQFYHNKYLPCATFNPACSALPDGDLMYEQCLR